jgi:hypothetical protein
VSPAARIGCTMRQTSAQSESIASRISTSES